MKAVFTFLLNRQRCAIVTSCCDFIQHLMSFHGLHYSILLFSCFQETPPQTESPTQSHPQAKVDLSRLAPRLCHMVRSENGYGFNLHSDRSRPGQYIRSLDPGSAADRAGLRPQDRLIEVAQCVLDNNDTSRLEFWSRMLVELNPVAKLADCCLNQHMLPMQSLSLPDRAERRPLLLAFFNRSVTFLYLCRRVHAARRSAPTLRV